MQATEWLHNLGQSIWLDNITRELLDSGTLMRYINELSVTGLTSNPTIFNHAVTSSTAYDTAIRNKVKEGKSGEALFFELAIEDLTRAADLFRPIHDRTNTVDGGYRWKCRRCCYDAPRSLPQPKTFLHAPVDQHLDQDPRTQQGLPAIEEAIFAGVPVTSRSCFRVSSIWRQQRRTCAASSGASKPAQPQCRLGRLTVHQPLGPAVRGQGAEALRNRLGVAIASARTKRLALCSVRHAGSACTTGCPGRSVCCGPVPEPRIPRPRPSMC